MDWRGAGRWSVVFVAVVVLAIGLRLPRFAATVDRYAGRSAPDQSLISAAEMQALLAAIGGEVVRVDVDNPYPSILAMIEFGRRGLAVDWAPSSWLYVVGGWRGWEPPTPPAPATLLLDSPQVAAANPAAVLLETRQFRLSRLQ